MSALAAALVAAFAVHQEPAKPAQEQAVDVAKVIEETIKSGDWKAFDKACDLEAFGSRVFGKATLSIPMRRLLMSLIRGDEVIGPMNLLRAPLMGSRAPKYLRLRTVEGAPRPFFRSVSPSGTFGYTEWILESSKEGPPRIVDAYMTAAGETLSASMTRYLMPTRAELEVLNSLVAPTIDDVTYGKKDLIKLLTLEQAGKTAEALEHFDKHSKLRGNKSALLTKLRLAFRTGKDEYLAAYGDFEEHYPKDPSLPYHRFGALKLEGKFDEALALVDGIDKEIGGDPFLEVQRAAIHAAAGRADKAEECAKRCTDAEPALAEGWYARVERRLAAKDHAGAVRLLREADKVSKLDLARLKGLDGFGDFEATNEYRNWLESRSSK